MTRTFVIFLLGLGLAFAIGAMSGYVLGSEHGAKAGYMQAVRDRGET